MLKYKYYMMQWQFSTVDLRIFIT